jgi:hypothetical protein
MALASLLHSKMKSMTLVIFYLIFEKDSKNKVVHSSAICLPIEKQIKEERIFDLEEKLEVVFEIHK